MVNSIDIHSLTLEELSGVVELYPWYAGARMEFCRRMSKLGALTENQLASTAMHICSRKLLAKLVRSQQPDCCDKDAEKLLSSYIEEPKEDKKIYVVGGDYFNQEEYNSVKNSEDSVFSKFANKAREEGYKDEHCEDSFMDFCTETLAKIYLEQECIEEAIEIYSKLSLRYPEKNAYFAALIDEIKQKAQ